MNSTDLVYVWDECKRYQCRFPARRNCNSLKTRAGLTTLGKSGTTFNNSKFHGNPVKETALSVKRGKNNGGKVAISRSRKQKRVRRLGSGD